MKKSILTIENSNALSYVINSVLDEYSVTNVASTADAVAHLHNENINDLIILDIDKDAKNIDLLEHISSSSILGSIPTVIISNSDDPSLKNRTAELGASLFLTKPFDPVYLSDKVKDLIYANSEAPARKRKTVFNLNIF